MRSFKGWAPTDQQHYDQVRDTTCKALRELRRSGSQADHSKGHANMEGERRVIEVAEAVIASAACQHRQGVGAGGGSRAAPKPRCPRNLTLLERATSKPNADHEQRHVWSKQARKERRRWQADLAIWKLRNKVDYKTSGMPLRLPDAQGERTANPAQWRQAPHAHCSKKYGSADPETAASDAQCDESQHLLLQRLDDEVARQTWRLSGLG